MNDLETKINDGFIKLVINYEILIVFIKGEITKGNDDAFWQKKLSETMYKKHEAANQITK